MQTTRKSARDRGYTHAWEKARARFLHLHPTCSMCAAAGRLTPATVVDHVVPHKGDPAKFWSEDNWQSLCKLHHDSTKRRVEMGRAAPAVGADGYPLPDAPTSAPTGVAGEIPDANGFGPCAPTYSHKRDRFRR